MSRRIIFIAEDFLPVPGGIAVSAERVTRHLAALGAEVTVVTFDYSRPLDAPSYVIEERDGRRTIYRLGPFFEGQPKQIKDAMLESDKARYRRNIFDAIERLAEKCAPEAIISFNATNAGLFGVYLSNIRGIPSIVSVRGSDVGRGMFSFHDLPILRMIVEGSAHVACVNADLHRKLLTIFPEQSIKMSVVQNSLDLPPSVFDGPLDYASRNTTWPKEDPIVIFLGIAREKKGIGLLLRAVEIANRTVPLRLLVIGPTIPDNYPGFGVLARRLKDSNLLACTGFTERAGALRLAQSGTILAMPSLDDGLANALLEGMAMGLCPVVSDVFSDVVLPGMGYIVPRNDVEALAHALVMAIQSKSTSKSFGAAAKQYVMERYRPAEEAQSYLDLVESALEVNRTSQPKHGEDQRAKKMK